jgi:hypothetical protein
LLRWVGSSLAIVALLYLVGMNVFVRTRLFRNAISFDPDSFRVDYASAYSVLPGRIHVEGLTIRGRDSAVEWILNLDRCDFRVSFVELLHRRFHANHVRGDGLTLRARRRLDEVTPSVVALPPVPGFRDPPRTDVGPLEPPLTDKTYNLWGAELDDVVADHVREIWIDTVRYSGDLTVRGRWVFQPLRFLEVGPAVVDLRSVDVSYGEVETWGEDLNGSLGVTLRPLDLREAEGRDFIEHTSVDVDASGTLHAERVANRLSKPNGDGPEVTRAVAPVHVRLLLDQGLLRSGTRVTMTPFDVEVQKGTQSFRALVDADARVEDQDGQIAGIARVGASSLRVRASSTDVATAESVSAELTTRELHLLDLGSESSGATFRADVAGARTDALAYWRSLFPMAKDIVVSGEASGEAHAEGRVADAMRGQIAGRASVSVGPLEIRDKALTLTANASAQIVLHRNDDGIDLSGSRVSVSDARARIQRSGSALHVIVPSVTASTPRCVLSDRGPRGDVSVDMPNAEISDLAGLASVLPLPDGMRVELGPAQATARLDMNLESMAASGHVRLTAPNSKIRAGDDVLAGEFGIAIEARAEGARTNFSGTTVEFTSPATQDAPDWWVRARLDRALLSLGQSVPFHGLFSANAKDASPLGAFIAKESPVPRWLVDAIPTNRLQITGDVLAGPSTFEVRSLVAKADGSSVNFEFESLAEWTEWAMLLEAGPIRAGIRAGDGGTQVVLFDARPWFQRQTEVLRAIESRGR